ncbi:MAG: nucleotidyltransferase domain-containing protein [Pseudomonadota bacterium]
MTENVPSLALTMAERMRGAPGLFGLFLAGSHGSGHADRFSDIDCVAVVAPDAHRRIADLWRSALETEEAVVYWGDRGAGPVLLNAVTEDWLRIDLITNTREMFARRRRPDVKALLDPEDLLSGLAAEPWIHQDDPAQVARIIDEFIRVLGLLPVALGRGELFTGVTGSDLLRGLLKDLLVARDARIPPGGALHLSRVLPPEDIALLDALPFPRPDRGEIIAANETIAATFFPLARAEAARLGIPWPGAFEAAARHHLAREIEGFRVNWG